ncbi:60S ribosomal protein L31 [Candidatus Parvarchaeota archaeon]|nr:60S ribosomal protein L31 [Candidatus Parvarchaeota archaeon]
MAEQRIITVNMRKAIESRPMYKRADAASGFLREFIKRHMKAKEVKIDTHVNDAIFKNGMKNPPSRIRVICSKDDKQTVKVNLVGSKEKKADGNK